MRIKVFVIFVILTFLISSILLPLAESKPNSEGAPGDKILRILFEVLAGKKILPPYMAPYSYFRMIDPLPVKAYPNVVNLAYLNQTEIVIGAKTGSNEWQSLINLSGGLTWGWFYQSLSFRFELLPPEDSPPGAWIANFEPKIITLEPSKITTDWKATPYDALKTKLTLRLNPSVDPNYPTQDVVLKVKVIRKEVIGSILTPPKYPTEFFSSPITKISWCLISGWYFQLLNYFSMGRKFVFEEEIFPPVEILIKVKKDHFAEIIPPSPMEIRPNQVLSIPVSIKNLGSHIDTFNFRVVTNITNLKISQPSAVTLDPGEVKQVMLTIAAPPVLWEPGKTRSIEIEAYSIEEPNKVFKNMVILTSRGIYVSGINAIYLSLFALLIIIAGLLIFYIRKKSHRIISFIKKHKVKITLPSKPKKEKKEDKGIIEDPKKKRIMDKIKREQEKQKRKINI